MTAIALRRPRARFGTRWRVPPLIALSIAYVVIVILAALIGPSVSIPVHDGRLVLGTWQRVILIDLDGPRQRDLYVSVR